LFNIQGCPIHFAVGVIQHTSPGRVLSFLTRVSSVFRCYPVYQLHQRLRGVARLPPGPDENAQVCECVCVRESVYVRWVVCVVYVCV
jgi:hypothetical protein